MRKTKPQRAGFRHLITLVQAGKIGSLKKEEKERAKRVKNWLEKYAEEDFKFGVQEKINEDVSLSDGQKKSLNMLKEILKKSKGMTEEKLFNEIYGIGSNFDPFSTLGNKNYVAEIMAMLLPFTLALSLAAPRLWHKALLWLAAESMLIVVIVAETRGSWLGLLVGLAVLLLYGADRFDEEMFMLVPVMMVSSSLEESVSVLLTRIAMESVSAHPFETVRM